MICTLVTGNLLRSFDAFHLFQNSARRYRNHHDPGSSGLALPAGNIFADGWRRTNSSRPMGCPDFSSGDEGKRRGAHSADRTRSDFERPDTAIVDTKFGVNWTMREAEGMNRLSRSSVNRGLLFDVQAQGCIDCSSKMGLRADRAYRRWRGVSSSPSIIIPSTATSIPGMYSSTSARREGSWPFNSKSGRSEETAQAASGGAEITSGELARITPWLATATVV